MILKPAYLSKGWRLGERPYTGCFYMGRIFTKGYQTFHSTGRGWLYWPSKYQNFCHPDKRVSYSQFDYQCRGVPSGHGRNVGFLRKTKMTESILRDLTSRQFLQRFM